MIYLDANVYINAAINPNKLGRVCRLILDAVQNRVLTNVYSSPLTLDEVLWKLRLKMDYKTAINSVRAMMNIPVKMVEINLNIFHDALDIASHYNMKPRDAIHAACMKRHGILEICSTDTDFDVIKGIKRTSPEKLKIPSH